MNGGHHTLNSEELSVLARARLRALSQMPYFAALLMRMTWVARPGIGTMGCDARARVYVDPEILDRWNTEELAGTLLHESMHLVRHHHDRCNDQRADPQLWNVAGDLEINDDLTAAHVRLPEGSLQPPKFGLPTGKSVEWYYEHLPINAHTACCGSAASGAAPAWELGDSREPPGMDELDIEQVVHEVAAAVKAAGSAPVGLRRWAEASTHTQVHWRRQLRRAYTRARTSTIGQADYSYARRSRRARHTDQVVRPAMVRPDARLAVVIDTSGSMNSRLLSVALTELQSILAMDHQPVDVVACDVNAVVTRNVRKLSDFEVIGGGGTNLGIGLAAAANLKPAATVVITITDGYTPWPPLSPSRARQLVIVVGDGPTGPEWATTVRISDLG